MIQYTIKENESQSSFSFNPPFNILNKFRVIINLYSIAHENKNTKGQHNAIILIKNNIKELNKEIIIKLLTQYLPTRSAPKNHSDFSDFLNKLLSKIPDNQQNNHIIKEIENSLLHIEEDKKDKVISLFYSKRKDLSPSLEYFFTFICSLFFMNAKNYSDSLLILNKLIKTLQNTKDHDVILGYCYFHLNILHKEKGEHKIILHFLLKSYSISFHYKNVYTESVIYNCILGNFLYLRLINSADKFRKYSTFFEVNIPQTIRYIFYMAIIDAFLLNYKKAYKSINSCLYKMAQKNMGDIKIKAISLKVIISLLLGKIPEQHLLYDKEKDMLNEKYLEGYYELIQAVRNGNLNVFNEICDKYKEVYVEDGYYSLVCRIRQSVIRTGLKNISRAYSIISFDDIAKILKLEGSLDVEHIIIKAISDGVIKVNVDSENKCIYMKKNSERYKSKGTLMELLDNTSICKIIHHRAIERLSYPNTKEKISKKSDDFYDEDYEGVDYMSDEDSY